MNNFWNERYASAGYAYGTAPNAFIREQLALLQAGRLWVPGCGEGRDAVYAARLGWHVEAFDASEAGLRKAEALAHQEKVQIRFSCQDASDVHVHPEQFDAVVLTFFHLSPELRNRFHRHVVDSLRSGGRIILEGFSTQQLGKPSGGPRDRDWLFTREIIENDFHQLVSEISLETDYVLDEGLYHQGEGSVVRYVGRKK